MTLPGRAPKAVNKCFLKQVSATVCQPLVNTETSKTNKRSERMVTNPD